MTVKEKTGYWKFKEKARDRALWRTRFGRRSGLVVRQTTEWTFFPGLTQILERKKKKTPSSLRCEEMESMVNHNNLGKYGELNFNVSLCIYIRTGSHTEKY